MPQPENPPLQLTYDTSQNPLTFDFVMCLAICRAYCNLHRFPDKFDVVLVNREFRAIGVEQNYSPEYRERKMRDVLIASATLCRWVGSLNIVRGDTPVAPYSGPTQPIQKVLKHIGKADNWRITPMVPKQLETIMGLGAKIPDFGFRAGEAFLERYREKLKNAVVMHPRVSSHNPARNSDKAIMQEVARLLKNDGVDVYFIPDIEDVRAGFSWSDFGAEPLMEAAFDLECRMAAAECALTNLIYSGGGNAAMLHFAPTSFLWTGFVDETHRVTSSAFFEVKGSKMGENPPWLNPETQLWDWTEKSLVTPEYMRMKLMNLIGTLRQRGR